MKPPYSFPVIFPWILIWILLSSCEPRLPDAPKRQGFFDRTTKKASVTVLTIRSREIPLVIRAEGKTAPIDRFQQNASSGGGRIAQVFTEEGQTVEVGESLLRFEETELKLKLDVARSQIEEAEAALEEARVKQKNKENLPEEEGLEEIGPEGIEESIAHHEATLKRARDEIELFEKQLEMVEIKSPIAGIVTQRKVSSGEEVKENQLLIEVLRIDPLRFSFQVPVRVAGNLKPADRVSVKFPQLGNREFSGEIATIGAEVGMEENVEIKLTIPNETAVLKAEMKGEVVIHTALIEKILTVPPSAINKTERSTYLFKIVNGKTKRVPVTTGEEDSGEVIILKGIEEGDQIATSNVEKLKEGVEVEIESNL